MNIKTYQNKNITEAGDLNFKTKEMDTGKRTNYQRPFLINADSLLVLLVLVAVAGNITVSILYHYDIKIFYV